MGFSQSGDTKADLKTEVMPREKTGLGEVAGTALDEGGHRGSQAELKREVKSGKNEVYPVQAKENFHLKSPLTAILQPGEELCSLTASCSIVPLRHHATCQQFGKTFQNSSKSNSIFSCLQFEKSELHFYSVYMKTRYSISLFFPSIPPSLNSF